MKRQSLAKSLMMISSASGVIVLVVVVRAALAETSMLGALRQSASATSSERQSTHMIDISIDANQDGISDQLLAETQKVQAFQDAELERFRATAESIDGSEDPAFEAAYEAYSTAVTAANIQLVARLPFSDNARKILAEIDRVGAQYAQYTAPYGVGDAAQSAIEAELRQLGESLDQDPSYVEVVDAQQKVFAFIDNQQK